LLCDSQNQVNVTQNATLDLVAYTSENSGPRFCRRSDFASWGNKG